jgi:hypothetical protein
VLHATRAGTNKLSNNEVLTVPPRALKFDVVSFVTCPARSFAEIVATRRAAPSPGFRWARISPAALTEPRFRARREPEPHPLRAQQLAPPPPTTSLLVIGWTRRGLIGADEVPGSDPDI